MHVIVIFSNFIENYCKGDDAAMKKTLSVILAVIKVADGWNDSGRYVVMGNVGSESEYFPVSL